MQLYNFQVGDCVKQTLKFVNSSRTNMYSYCSKNRYLLKVKNLITVSSKSIDMATASFNKSALGKNETKMKFKKKIPQQIRIVAPLLASRVGLQLYLIAQWCPRDLKNYCTTTWYSS